MNRILKAFYAGATLLILGCAAEDKLSDNTLPGEEKTPLRVEATLAADNALTRAEGKQFEAGDVLLAYLRHTTGGSKGGYTTTAADKAPLLAAFKKGSATMAGDATTLETADLTSVLPNDPTTPAPLYWDDFSNSATTATDLRTSGHGLQSFYGYCFNGGATSTDGSATGGNLITALDLAAGTLGWTLPTTQNTAAIVKGADLLWSAEQETVVYNHNTTQAADHRTLTIPYTHAMSQVTVTLTTDATFTTAAPLTGTTLTLNAMNTVTALTAPTSECVSTTPDNITMFGHDYSSGSTRSYSAIVAPGTKLEVGKTLLDIRNVDDNDYTLTITGTAAGQLLHSSAWAAGHSVVETAEATYILTRSGYNYHLDITVSKTAIAVKASLEEWTPVNATGEAIADFPSVAFSMTGELFADETTIHVYQLLANGESDTSAKRTNAKYGAPSTTATYDASGNVWTNSPAVYWHNKTDNYYFRALSQANSSVAQGTDLLWATTPAHGTAPNTFAAGDAIAPRSNEVPLAFEHAMSKVSITLETATGTVGTNSPVVDLTDATIALSKLHTTGSVSIEDGSISFADTNSDDEVDDNDRTANALTATPHPIADLIVLPQTIKDDSRLTITLSDGTTYSLQLNQCVLTGTSTTVGQWERGKHYQYTIHLEKEQILFRALVKDWETKEGSGNANLEWD